MRAVKVVFVKGSIDLLVAKYLNLVILQPDHSECPEP